MRDMREERRTAEKEMREEKRRKIEEEKGPRMGWSKPKVEWPIPREDDEDLDGPENQMRADRFGKRSKGDTGEEMEENE